MYEQACKALLGGDPDGPSQPILTKEIYSNGWLQWRIINLQKSKGGFFGEKPATEITGNLEINLTMLKPLEKNYNLIVTKFYQHTIAITPDGRIDKPF